MLAQTPGKIFLADQRGLLETSQFRRHCTFSFGGYADAHKGPFGRLYALNEETLAGGHSLELPVAQASYILLLPITGTLEFSTAPRPAATVGVEELRVVAVPANGSLRLTNPYETDLISFLHIWLLADEPLVSASEQLFPFALETENQLVEVVAPAAEPSYSFSVSIGRFAGRGEALYRPRPGATFFAFVLSGAFELEGRLLHERDGLALWEAEEVELEALSNHAIVLVIELR